MWCGEGSAQLLSVAASDLAHFNAKTQTSLRIQVDLYSFQFVRLTWGLHLGFEGISHGPLQDMIMALYDMTTSHDMIIMIIPKKYKL